MTLSSISSTTSLAAAQFIPSSTTKPVQDRDDASTPGTTGASRFASAISDAFASIGISLDGTATTSASTSATDATTAGGTDESDALGSFLQSLLAALHGQPAGSAPPTDEHVERAHHGHGGKLEANLKSLIAELQSPTATTATADPGTVASTATSTSTSTTPTDPALAALEQKFDALLATTGTSTSGGSDSLATFLQSLAAGLHGAPPTGNVVSTQA